mgnify:CR=1 FL=1
MLNPEYHPIKAPKCSMMSCKGWHQEAALRMLMNNLDEEVGDPAMPGPSAASPTHCANWKASA